MLDGEFRLLIIVCIYLYWNTITWSIDLLLLLLRTIQVDKEYLHKIAVIFVLTVLVLVRIPCKWGGLERIGKIVLLIIFRTILNLVWTHLIWVLLRRGIIVLHDIDSQAYVNSLTSILSTALWKLCSSCIILLSFRLLLLLDYRVSCNHWSIMVPLILRINNLIIYLWINLCIFLNAFLRGSLGDLFLNRCNYLLTDNFFLFILL